MTCAGRTRRSGHVPCAVGVFQPALASSAHTAVTSSRSRRQVTFVVQERVQRIALWIESAFNAKLPSLQNTQKIEAAFVSLRDRSHSLVRTKPHQTEGG